MHPCPIARLLGPSPRYPPCVTPPRRTPPTENAACSADRAGLAIGQGGRGVEQAGKDGFLSVFPGTRLAFCAAHARYTPAPLTSRRQRECASGWTPLDADPPILVLRRSVCGPHPVPDADRQRLLHRGPPHRRRRQQCGYTFRRVAPARPGLAHLPVDCRLACPCQMYAGAPRAWATQASSTARCRAARTAPRTAWTDTCAGSCSRPAVATGAKLAACWPTCAPSTSTPVRPPQPSRPSGLCAARIPALLTPPSRPGTAGTQTPVRQYHRDYYRPDNLCCIVVGTVPEAELLGSLGPMRAKIRAKGARPPQPRCGESRSATHNVVLAHA